MSLSSFLAKPSLRLPLLTGTVIATVATSEPGWQVTDDTEKTPLHLEPGGSTEVRLALEGSHPVRSHVTLEKLVAREGKLLVEATDDRPGCSANAASFESDDGIWRVLPPTSGSVASSSELHRIELHSLCSSQEKRGTVAYRFVNEGATALDFEWHGTASISGNESDDAPEGAFVNVGVMP
jgi:hypothetical protein